MGRRKILNPDDIADALKFTFGAAFPNRSPAWWLMQARTFGLRMVAIDVSRSAGFDKLPKVKAKRSAP